MTARPLNILFLHGWHSVPGGVKPTFLQQHGHRVINPALDDNDFPLAVRTAQAEFDRHQPLVVVGSSRGGAVAMNISSGAARLVLLCPAWKNWGPIRTVKPDTLLLHSPADDVIPFEASVELVITSGLPSGALKAVGTDHRLAEPEPLAAMLQACLSVGSPCPLPIFGQAPANAQCTDLPAAFGIFFGPNQTVAALQQPSGKYGLPGGSARTGETPETTLLRQVREELGMPARITQKLPDALQYFFAAEEPKDPMHYRMQAAFFLAEFESSRAPLASQKLVWLPLAEMWGGFFHACQAWATDQAAAQVRVHYD